MTRKTKTSRKAEESLPVDLSQHFPESEPQPNDVSVCRLFDMSHTAVSIMTLVISTSLPCFLQLFSDILAYTLFIGYKYVNTYTPSFTDTLSHTRILFLFPILMVLAVILWVRN